MQDNVKNFDQGGLVEMLIDHTEKLTKLLTQHRFDSEYTKCKEIIELLSQKIGIPENLANNNDTTGTNIPVFKE